MNKRVLELAQQIWPEYTGSHVNHAKFANLLIEECARVAEDQARVYTGEHQEGAGCYAAANAIRNLLK